MIVEFLLMATMVVTPEDGPVTQELIPHTLEYETTRSAWLHQQELQLELRESHFWSVRQTQKECDSSSCQEQLKNVCLATIHRYSDLPEDIATACRVWLDENS